MKILDLFAGTQSLKRHLPQDFQIVSVDVLAKLKPDICADISRWDYQVFNPGDFDVVWASPPCTEYSRAKTVGHRDIEGANRLVQRTLEIIQYLQPRLWFIENPQTGKLKLQPFMEGLPFYDISYCKYGFEYRKQTRIWTNLEGFQAMSCNLDCEHLETNQATGKLVHRVNFASPRCRSRYVPLRERHGVPPLLIRDLFN
jgi:site-specific DNA-cytosine methylase